MKRGHPPVHQIELRIAALSELVNSMDPTPFHHRDLDRDAVKFLESWALEFPPASHFRIVVHIETMPPARKVQVEQFHRRRHCEQQERRPPTRGTSAPSRPPALAATGCAFATPATRWDPREPDETALRWYLVQPLANNFHFSSLFKAKQRIRQRLRQDGRGRAGARDRDASSSSGLDAAAGPADGQGRQCRGRPRR